MCLLIFAFQKHPRYPLLMAANRDEFHARPTQPAAFWAQHPQLRAGRDLEAGGTWMGVTRGGRFAAVTNFRDPARTAPAPRSRGDLPVEYLTGDESPEVFLHRISARDNDYAGYNLLLGDCGSLWYYSNFLEEPERQPTQLQPGVYGLSNALLDTPWPKVTRGKSILRALTGGEASHDLLAESVASGELAQEQDLHPHGLSGEMDRLLSAQFIVTPRYGTRATTTLWMDDAGCIGWRERSFDAQGQPTGDVEELLRPD